MTHYRLHSLIILIVVSCLPTPAADARDAIEVSPDVPPGLPSVARVTAVTRGPKHHFVGYYGITPWDAAGRRLFCLEADFGNRLVKADDKAGVCLVDPATGAVERVAETSAWNLQQGAMLHWLPTAPDRRLIYNDRIDGRLVSVVLDVTDKARRTIDRPIAAIAPDGRSAVGLNFDRLRQIRPVTGYAGGTAAGPPEKRPKDDGLFAIDVATGRSRLLVSVDDCCRLADTPAALDGQPIWLEHPIYSRDGSRVFFIARGFHPESRRIVSAPLVVRADGTGLKPLLPWGVGGASHFDWLDGDRIVITREFPDARPPAPEPTSDAPVGGAQSPSTRPATRSVWRHLLLYAGDDPNARARVPPGGAVLAPDVLTRDGHCTVSPDGRWMVTDSYPDEDRRQHLYVMEIATGRAARIATFAAPPEYRGDWRCDLHPRWDRDSRRICIDSTHDGVRQVYVIELRLP